MEEQIVYKKVSELKNNPQNPRKNDGAVESVAKSIEKYGFRNPLIIDKNNVVWCGNTRLKASRKLGLDKVPCIVVEDLTEQQMTELALLDNKTNEIAEWDFDMLGDILEDVELDEFEIDWEIPKLETKEEVEEDDFDVEAYLLEEPKAKPGDIYQLGEHRLMCGDSTKEEDVEKLMNEQKADMVFVDPPYGMKKEKDGVANDNLNYDDLLEFNKKWIPLTFKFSKNNGSWYCWGIDEPLMDIYSNILKPMIKNKEIAFRNLITWDKGNCQGQLAEEFRMYPIADEKCLFVMIGGDSMQGFCVNQDDYNENMDKVRVYLEKEIKKLKQSDKTIANALGYKDGRTVNHWWSKSQFAIPTKENYEALREYGRSVLKDCEFLKKDYDKLKKDYDELKKDFYAGRSYFNNTHDNMNNVWHFSKTSNEERKMVGGHATPKPIALCSRAIKSSSRENEIVLDLFGGSGSTLIACEQLNRKCYMCELEPKWVDVIIQRWEDFTDKKAVKL